MVNAKPTDINGCYPLHFYWGNRSRDETSTTKAEASIMEFDRFLSVYAPIKYSFEKGFVAGGAIKKDRTKESAVEVVHPITKVIKAHKEYKPSAAITVVDIRGGSPLKMASTKDNIKSGGEVISFDPATGQLFVNREFEDYTGFNMTVKPDSPAVGPLGGGLKSDGGMGGYGGGMGGGDGGMGPGGSMGPGGPG